MTTQNRTQEELVMKTKVNNNDKEVIMTTNNRTQKELYRDCPLYRRLIFVLFLVIFLTIFESVFWSILVPPFSGID